MRKHIGYGGKKQFTRTARKIKSINVKPYISSRGTCL